MCARSQGPVMPTIILNVVPHLRKFRFRKERLPLMTSRAIQFSDRLVLMAVAGAFLLPACIVGAMGYLGINEMDLLHADAQSIANSQWVDVELATEAMDLSNQNARINMRIALAASSEEINLLISQRANNTDHITALIARLQ